MSKIRGQGPKALIGRVATGLLSPGRISLVAVDALVLGLPILTTSWPFHAPEVDYLPDGSSRLTGPNDPIGFAEFVLSASSPAPQARQPNPNWAYPHLNEMIENFREGVVANLNSTP